MITAWNIFTALEKFGYDTVIVSSGEKAIKKAEETKPDLILMDIMLIGGINVKNARKAIKPAEEIHKRFNIPVIYTSINPELLREIKPKSYILEKPFEEEDLLNIIGKALQKQQEH
jgi:CheY-like chemotaxis protein